MKFSHTSVTVGAVVVTAVLASTLSAGATALITGAEIKDGTITARDLADGSVTSAKVHDGTLTRRDMAPGALIPGPRGVAGQRGPQGVPGPSGGSIGLVTGVPTIQVLPATAGLHIVRAFCAHNQVAVAPEYSLTWSLHSPAFGPYVGSNVRLNFSMQSPDRTEWIYGFVNTENAAVVKVTAGVLCSTNP